MAYSVDFRRRVVEAVGHDQLGFRAAGRRFRIPHATIRGWGKREPHEGLEPRKTGPKRGFKLNDDGLQALRQMVDQRPGITSEEAAERLNHKLSSGYILTLWCRMALTYKKR